MATKGVLVDEEYEETITFWEGTCFASALDNPGLAVSCDCNRHMDKTGSSICFNHIKELFLANNTAIKLTEQCAHAESEEQMR